MKMPRVVVCYGELLGFTLVLKKKKKKKFYFVNGNFVCFLIISNYFIFTHKKLILYSQIIFSKLFHLTILF